MDRLPCKSLLTAFCTLMVHHAVVFLLLTCFNGGESQETGQPQPIVAMVGDDITLPCHVKLDSDAGVGMLEWSRLDLNPRFVHVWRSGGDHLVDQNPSYRGRTSVSIDKLKQGDMSLKLSKVKLTDEGTYRCFIPRLITDSVQLIVGAVINMSTVSSGELECKSEGWYPEPEVSWLDGEGNLLPAGPTETVRGPDGLYTVSSRVTVEKRHSNNFTCRVRQENITQTRETHIQVPDDFFEDPSKPSASTIIGLFAGLMIVLALVYAVCRWRQNKLKKKNHEEEEPQRVREKTRDPVNNSSEQEFLVKTETENTEETKNLENEEEENNERFLGEDGGRPCQSEEATHQSQQNVNRGNSEEIPEGTTTATEGQSSTELEGQEDETRAGQDTKPEEETNRTKPRPQTETKPEQPTEEGREKSQGPPQGPEDGGGPTGEMSGDGHAEELAERESVTDRGSSVDPIVAEETKILDNELEENNTRSLSEEGGRSCQREEETHQSQQNVNRGNSEEIPEATTTATEGQGSTEPEGQEDETQAGRDTR